MTKKITSLLSLLFLLSFIFQVTSQETNQNKADSIILRALNDELYRNLNELSDKESGKPFYISYIYLDGEVTQASAILGTLRYSDKFKTSSWNIRLMMGDYNINDENFQDNFSKDQNENAAFYRQPPIESDYMGIRNTFWWNTSQVFRSASKTYKSKLTALKNKPITEEEELLPDYTEATPVRIHRSDNQVSMQKEELEFYVKNISSVFKEFKDVYISSVSAYSFNSTVYIVNTEGSEIRIPLKIALADVSANVYSAKGEVLRNSLSFISPDYSELPPADTIKNAARVLANYLINLKKAEIISETYTGPVLFHDDGVARIFSDCLFEQGNPLIANREPLINSLSKSMIPKNTYSRETRLDKRIISKDISVRALPHLTAYNGTPLMGSFEVDAECIVPPEEILLISKGVLKTMLSDRIPTKNIKHSNGHNRIGLSYGGFNTGMAPGVIVVESENRKQTSDLKQQMIEIARDKGLDYVIVVKPLLGGECISPLCFYKFDINTNNEELIYNMSFPMFDIKTLNKIVGTGEGTFVNNMVFNGRNIRNQSGKNGFPASFIVPDALLIEEMELNPEFPNSDLDLPFYDYPSESFD